jgi:hypothetical protein
MQSEEVAIWAHAVEVAQVELLQSALQNPPAKPWLGDSQVSPLAQSAVERQASPIALGGLPPGSAQLPLTHRCVLEQSRGPLQGVDPGQPARAIPPARRRMASLVTSGSSVLQSNQQRPPGLTSLQRCDGP